MCQFLHAEVKTGTGFLQMIDVNLGFGLCSMPDDPVQVYFTRLYGVEGTLRNVSWAPSRLTLRHIVAVRGKLDKLSIEISAVVYGGFLWDLRFWWFASRINIDKMLAANTPSSHHVSAMAQTIQTWNNLILPWCSADHQRKWRRSYVRVVDTLLATFRGSFLLLRTQVNRCTFL